MVIVLGRGSFPTQVEGGWATCFRAHLEEQLLGSCGLATAGTVVGLDGQPVLIWARLAAVLADGGGLGRGTLARDSPKQRLPSRFALLPPTSPGDRLGEPWWRRAKSNRPPSQGHAYAWDWQREAAMKPCIKHVNVLNKAQF